MSSLSKLREEFDRVLIKYTDNSCDVMLVKGLDVFTGRSKCHENDNFNRKLGRKIASGRAEFAFKVVKGEKSSRDNTCFRDGDCRHNTTRCNDVKDVDKCIINFLPTRAPKQNAS